jgi:pyruvate/2-oxoglutarate dehydrogenase complex dihydrolipoamide dehydrogenase (E3) component
VRLVPGFLKIIAAKSTNDDEHVIVGVHIIGEGATEIIQTGSILVHWKATLGTIARTPFAAVTLTGLYLLAADDAIEKANLKIEKKV